MSSCLTLKDFILRPISLFGVWKSWGWPSVHGDLDSQSETAILFALLYFTSIVASIFHLHIIAFLRGMGFDIVQAALNEGSQILGIILNHYVLCAPSEKILLVQKSNYAKGLHLKWRILDLCLLESGAVFLNSLLHCLELLLCHLTMRKQRYELISFVC